VIEFIIADTGRWAGYGPRAGWSAGTGGIRAMHTFHFIFVVFGGHCCCPMGYRSLLSEVTNQADTGMPLYGPRPPAGRVGLCFCKFRRVGWKFIFVCWKIYPFI